MIIIRSLRVLIAGVEFTDQSLAAVILDIKYVYRV